MASPPPNQRFSNLPQGGAGQRESQHLQQQQQDQQNYSNMYAGNPGSESHGLGQQGQQQSAQPYNFNPVRSSASSGSGSGSGSDHHASSALGRPLSPSHRNSTYSMMDQPGNTVGLDSTSAAIARGEVGANYSRYSTGNLAALAQATGLGGAAGGIVASNSNHRLSSLSNGNGTEELQIEMDSLPAAPYANSNSGLLSSPSGNAPFTRSRFSEYGLGDASSSESPSFRDSTLFDSNDRRGSMQYYSNNKSMEDTSLLWNEKNVEADDFLHDPRTLATQRSDRWWNFPTSGRGLVNAIGISVLLGGFLALFMGWPIHVYVVSRGGTGSYGWNMGNTNSSGQVPDIPNLPSLIDADTPDEVKYGIRKGYNGRDYQLVFSDEFNEDGRTFFPGDDPFWEAVDIHYWQTRDLEWYDPDVPTTRDGNLEITLTEQPIHGLNFRSGMIQSWNKLCFNKGAYIEVKASLPGNSRASGYWPGIWTMGNLGRAGYGATNDGMWPYSYDSCDVGTLYKQRFSNNTPVAAYTTGGYENDFTGELSVLAGQRTSACTCKGQPHPGPKNNVGRGAPEIDILEAQVDWRGYGTGSQSIQIAPFDAYYNWDNRSSAGMELYNSSITLLNSWKGAPTQEAASAVTRFEDCYEGERYESFGYEYTSGGSADSQITWSVGDIPTWTLKAGAFPPQDDVQIGQRLISEEPMYIILNLAISASFQSLQFDRLTFPGTFRIDYVRVWQPKGETSITCDPDDHPTTDYINRYMEYYTNPNITTWPDELWPKNSLIDDC